MGAWGKGSSLKVIEITVVNYETVVRYTSYTYQLSCYIQCYVTPPGVRPYKCTCTDLILMQSVKKRKSLHKRVDECRLSPANPH